MKKVTTVGASALAMCAALAGGAVLVAPGASAVAAAAPYEAAGLPQTSEQLAYVQRGQVVTVYRGGQVLAEVEAQSAAHPGGRAKLVLKVKAHKTFAFRAGQFLWADAKGDHEAFNPVRKVRVPGGSTGTVSIRFDGVRDGNVVWAPRRENTVGVWQVEGSTAKGAAQLLSPSYVQRDSVVSVYKAGKVVARVTAQSAVHAKGKGSVRLDVEAVQKFSLRPSAFVWSDRDGDRHKPVAGKKVSLEPKTTRSITVKYDDVAAGGLVWSPRAHLVAGAWGIG
ncbi:hypothetical protein LWF15_00235 [Kineosporia rhizophila]|uniref:hypothetical protein n=1 Tax=Kineosporia rhizophila TaxID=84633 RepID=UPI001E37BC30|nr:hypothetical protein [Kineosporia rhizophila]MCE0533932.1 hypothetical protein [Kineosporia rhizophila]